MTLEGFIVIATTVWIYAKVGGWLINQMQKQERQDAAERRYQR